MGGEKNFRCFYKPEKLDFTLLYVFALDPLSEEPCIPQLASLCAVSLAKLESFRDKNAYTSLMVPKHTAVLSWNTCNAVCLDEQWGTLLSNYTNNNENKYWINN